MYIREYYVTFLISLMKFNYREIEDYEYWTLLYYQYYEELLELNLDIKVVKINDELLPNVFILFKDKANLDIARLIIDTRKDSCRTNDIWPYIELIQDTKKALA